MESKPAKAGSPGVTGRQKKDVKPQFLAESKRVVICGSPSCCFLLSLYRRSIDNLICLHLMGLSSVGPSYRTATSSRRVDCFQSLVWSTINSFESSQSVAREPANRVSSTRLWVMATIMWPFGRVRSIPNNIYVINLAPTRPSLFSPCILAYFISNIENPEDVRYYPWEVYYLSLCFAGYWTRTVAEV